MASKLPKQILSSRAFSRDHTVETDHLAWSKVPRVRGVSFLENIGSCEAYRHIASIFKLLCLFLTSFLQGLNPIQAAEINQLFGVNRIVVKGQSPIEVRRGDSSASPGICWGKPTKDLLLRFKERPVDWEKELREIQAQKKHFCDLRLYPLREGFYELRIRFHLPSQKELGVLTYANKGQFVIDQWLRPKAETELKSSPRRALAGNEWSQGLVNSLEKNFSDNNLWASEAGQKIVLPSNKPELDPYRGFGKEKNLGLSNVPYERRGLEIPVLAFPENDPPIKFSPEKFPFLKLSENPNIDRSLLGVYKGINLVSELVKKKEYLKAQRALEVLEKSEFKTKLKNLSAYYPAIKGKIYIELSKERNNLDIFMIGSQVWRKGLVDFASSSSQNHPHVEFMALELARLLFSRQRYYQAASLLAWSKRYSWSTKVDERFGYLLGEAFFELSLFEEAKQVFRAYFMSRADMPLTTMVDRRLLPSAAFRVGDVLMKQKRWEQAIKEYSQAIDLVPGSGKFTFEGQWLAKTLAKFPHVLFNRAEAYLHLGQEKDALRELRAYLFLDKANPRVGLVLYRIGDLLDRVSSNKDKVQGIFRECAFRSSKTIGGRLCAARKAAIDLKSATPKAWARHLAAIEDLPNGELRIGGVKFREDDIKVFSSILAADALLHHKLAYDSLALLDSTRKYESSAELSEWHEEYSAVALSGYYQKLLDEERYKDLVRSYETRRRSLLYRRNRPEVMFSVSEAYYEMGLFHEAKQTYKEAVKVAKIIDRKLERPFDKSTEEWKHLLLAIDIELYKNGDLPKRELAQSADSVEINRVSDVELKIKYTDAVSDYKSKIKYWEILSKKRDLSWGEIEEYSRDLAGAKKFSKSRQVLENSVGEWFLKSNGDQKAAGPGVLLLMRLAEARSRDRAFEASVRIYNYLSGLQAKELANIAPREMLFYKKGLLQKNLGRFDDARQSFESAKTLAPQSLWGKLSASAQKTLVTGSM